MSVAHKTDKANAKHAPATSASENFEKRIPPTPFFFLFLFFFNLFIIFKFIQIKKIFLL